MPMRNIFIAVIIAAWPSLAFAQEAISGHTPSSSVGQAGQRENPGQPMMDIGIIDSRIQNRVQSRIRNRIDRFYNPQANAVSPFKAANDQIKNSSRQIQR